MFGKKKSKSQDRIVYDPEEKTPVIHCSICNGEQVGGLKDNATGRFEEIMLIRNGEDLEKFEKLVGKTGISKEY